MYRCDAKCTDMLYCLIVAWLCNNNNINNNNKNNDYNNITIIIILIIVESTHPRTGPRSQYNTIKKIVESRHLRSQSEGQYTIKIYFTILQPTQVSMGLNSRDLQHFEHATSIASRA